MEHSWLPVVLAIEWPLLALLLSGLLTVSHALDEVFGDGGPLWDEFGRIAGVEVNPAVGATLVLGVLPAALIGCAWLGYGSNCVAALSILAGAKLGDAVFSHWLLWAVRRSRPNPGIYTSLVAAAEALSVILMFPVVPEFVVGAALAFALVVPTLGLFRGAA